MGNKRNIYDRRHIEMMAMMHVCEKHPEWSDEEKRRVGSSEEEIQKEIKRQITTDLAKKIQKESGSSLNYMQHLKRAIWIMDNVPEELIPNINEWIEDKPISNIPINEISITDIMHQFGDGLTIDFEWALRCMIYWKETGYKDKSFCKNFFYGYKMQGE